MPTFPVTPKEVMEDEQKNMVIIHATSQASFHEELKDDEIPAEEWTYCGEYIFMLSMTEDEDKVKRVVEFVDSKGSERLLGLIKKGKKRIWRRRTLRVHKEDALQVAVATW
jgi:hypothetical protein